MNIDRSNYEVYFLDYLDGNLPDDQIDDFLDFLTSNPDLRRELEEVSAIKIPAENHVFQNKQALLKNELTGSTAFDSRAVAFMENDLSEEDQIAFLSELTSNPEKEKQFSWFAKTRLNPDTTIEFPDKASLLKKPARKVVLLWASRVAAVFVLLFAGWAVWDFSPEQDSSLQLADEQPVVSTQERSKGNRQPVNPVSEKKIEQPLVAKQQELANEPISTVQSNLGKSPALKVETLMVQREAIPEKLEPLVYKPEHALAREQLDLVEMKSSWTKPHKEFLTVDEYLAEKVLNKPKDEPLTFGSLISAGLDAVASVSNERLDYETNARGKVSEISLNTRILAFSIPLKKER